MAHSGCPNRLFRLPSPCSDCIHSHGRRRESRSRANLRLGRPVLGWRHCQTQCGQGKGRPAFTSTLVCRQIGLSTFSERGLATVPEKHVDRLAQKTLDFYTGLAWHALIKCKLVERP